MQRGDVFGSRRTTLTALLGFWLVVAAALLFDVLATVFFAVTVAYLLAPFQARLVDGGLPRQWASAVTTTVAGVATLVPFGLVMYLVYRRRDSLIALIANLPAEFVVAFGEFVYRIDVTTLLASARGLLSTVAVTAAQVLPVLALKFALFVFVVFGLLVQRGSVAHALLAAVPVEYHDLAFAYHERTRETLFAIYVLQAATAAGTFVLAVPTLYLLGYPFVVTLGFIAAVLQFLPVVGPSLLVLGLVAYQVSVGATVAATLTLVVGMIVIAGLPDVLIRPRLARETADLPGSLYFVGFVGGLLTVGPVGIIAGPLVVALVAETIELLATANSAPQGKPTQ